MWCMAPIECKAGSVEVQGKTGSKAGGKYQIWHVKKGKQAVQGSHILRLRSADWEGKSSMSDKKFCRMVFTGMNSANSNRSVWEGVIFFMASYVVLCFILVYIKQCW